MQPYFAVPTEGIEDKSFAYLKDATKKTDGWATLDVDFITFFKDWWDLTIFSVLKVNNNVQFCLEY